MTIEAKDINVISTSRKGAAQIEHAGKKVWIRPQAAKALAEGRVLPQVEKALADADERADEAKNKRPYQKCRYAEIRDISEKAVLVRTFDGGEAILPKSQIRGYTPESANFGDKGDAILVPAWLAEQKNLQVSSKFVWLDK